MHIIVAKILSADLRLRVDFSSIIHTLFTCEYNIVINRAHIIKMTLKD